MARAVTELSDVALVAAYGAIVHVGGIEGPGASECADELLRRLSAGNSQGGKVRIQAQPWRSGVNCPHRHVKCATQSECGARRLPRYECAECGANGFTADEIVHAATCVIADMEARRSAGRVEAGSEQGRESVLTPTFETTHACPNCWALAQCTCGALGSITGAVTREGGKIKP